MMDSKPGGKQVTSRHLVGSSANRDLWVAVRSGTVHDVDAALAVLKKTNGSIDARDRFGSTALHIATWRNHVPIVRRLLVAGADPDARDGESGWGSLHRALHFGHLAVAGALIEGGASLLLEDAKGRIPADLVSGPLKQAIASPCNQDAGATEVFSWGNGSNYQLGTGTAGIQRVPCRVEALQGLDVVTISAAKFHSVAVTSKGDIYSWGFGRGGRLGHEDYSGQVAVITPRQITSGLGGRCVKTVAAAKHHTVVATEGGEVYTWGTNREGQLGYPSVNTQSTPRRVSTLKARVVAVAAANKHSAAITEGGEVFTWGCNREGQLGYGTSNSASNCVPRCVESLKGKTSAAVSATKYHTVVLADGEVFTWGYKMVTPRRVVVLRNTKKGGAVPLKFHLSERARPHVVAIAAGVVHSTAISEEGLAFCWLSADPHLHAHQLISMTGHQVVAVSAGKYRTAVATATGDVYAWDGESVGDNTPIPVRIHGIKHVLGLGVGETHSLAVTGIYVPLYSPKLEPEVPVTINATVEESDNDDEVESRHFEIEKAVAGVVRDTPSLKAMCQKVVAETIIEPKNALQLLEFSESLGANELRRHCEDLILHNLDYILTVSATSFGLTRPSVFADLEKSWDACSSQPWSHRQLPVPSATLPAIVDSEEEEDENHVSRIRKGHSHLSAPIMSVTGFLQDGTTGIDGAGKHVRAVRKKLQQIEALEWRLSKGQALDEQQMAKLRSKPLLVESLKALELGNYQESDTGKVVPHTSFEKSENVPSIEERSKRQRNKSKKTNVHKTEMESSNNPATTDEMSKEDIPGEALNVKEPTDPEAVPDSPINKPAHSFKVSKASKAPTQERVSKTSSKAKSKKGGLSLFLSGALDGPPPPEKASPVPVVVKGDGPAWGGALVHKESASLRNIQSEQKAESSSIKPEKVHKEGKAPASEKLPTEGTPRVSLSQFVRSSAPIAVTPPKTGNVAPPWVATSPASLPSLRDIQMQQVKQKERAFSSRGSPQTGSPLTSAVLGSTSTTTPESAESPSCWFKPDTTSPSSIRCIQIEEKAMKDLRRLYKNVKIVDRSF